MRIEQHLHQGRIHASRPSRANCLRVKYRVSESGAGCEHPDLDHLSSGRHDRLLLTIEPSALMFPQVLTTECLLPGLSSWTLAQGMLAVKCVHGCLER